MGGRTLVAAAIGALTLGAVCRADVLLFPNGLRRPGELGGATAGAWTALASGPEAGWYNAAGLATEPGNQATAGADALRYSEPAVGGESTARLDAGPGYLALAWGPEPQRAGLPVGVGLFLHWPLARDLDVSESSRDSVDSSTIPDSADPGGLDVFSDGIQRSAHRSGSGRLWVLAMGVAFGAELGGWLRVGAGLNFERVQFAERSTALLSYQAENEAAPHESYGASLQSEARYEGLGQRLVPVAGVQMRLLPGIIFAASARLPSRDLGGRGSVFLSRTSRARLQSDTNPGTTIDELIVAEDESAPFRLRTPLEVTYAVGFASQRLALEIDLERGYGQSRYTVLPVPRSGPPSTSAYQAPAFRTGALPSTRWALGMTYAATEATALAIGVRDERSSVPERDAVFRRLHLYSVTTGAILRRGAFTGSLGLGYQWAPQQFVSFPEPLGESREERRVDFQEWTLRLGASWLM
jgi:hypothetical protein